MNSLGRVVGILINKYELAGALVIYNQSVKAKLIKMFLRNIFQKNSVEKRPNL